MQNWLTSNNSVFVVIDVYSNSNKALCFFSILRKAFERWKEGEKVGRDQKIHVADVSLIS